MSVIENPAQYWWIMSQSVQIQRLISLTTYLTNGQTPACIPLFYCQISADTIDMLVSQKRDLSIEIMSNMTPANKLLTIKSMPT